MRREKNSLYFEPNEESKFFRAINLYGKLRGDAVNEPIKTIMHEKAHRREIIKLGHADKIRGYRIEFARKNPCYSICLLEKEISKEHLAQIRLAPDEPSDGDVMIFKSPFFTYKEYWKMLGMKSKTDRKNLIFNKLKQLELEK